jgi:hypothetical protein
MQVSYGSHMDILFVTLASETKMPPNQETICFEELQDFQIKIIKKKQFRSQVNCLTFIVFTILISY